MSAVALLQRCLSDGLELVLEPPDTIVVRGPTEVSSRYLPDLKASKPELLRLLATARPLPPADHAKVESALDAAGEICPATRNEILSRCATDPEALAFWTSPARTPDPRQDLYRRWLEGITAERVLLTLTDGQVQEAVTQGVVSRDLAQTSVLLLMKVPRGETGPGAVGLLAIPREKYRDFSPANALEAMTWQH